MPAIMYLAPATAVLRASLSDDQRTVMLTVGQFVYGGNYTLTINQVRDCAYAPNAVADNTTIHFVPAPYTSVDIGGATPAGTLMTVSGGFDVAGAGADIGGNADQFAFHYQMLSGDFDLQVQIQSPAAVDFWTKAGLMARESLDSGSRFAAALSTPNLLGSYLGYRVNTNGTVAGLGNFPPNFPNAWLRMQRTGNLFSGYASYDGLSWTRLGSVNLALGTTVYVGLAVCSHRNGELASAQFRQVGTTVSTLDATPLNPKETLGPSSRRTPIVLSEIMYKPAARADGRNVEFLELFNSNPYFQDLSGYRLAGDIQYAFPPGTVLPAGGFLAVAAAPADLQSVYGLASVLGPYTNSLKASGTLRLLDEAGAVLLDMEYQDTAPWPAAADGAGHSLVLARPSYGEADPRAWDISDVIGGSPGRFETFTPSPLRNVVINEILAHTDLPDIDALELYNHGNQAVDLSGCILTDTVSSNKFVVPTNTVVLPRSCLVFDATQLGFSLSAAGETVYLKNATSTRVLDAVKFEPSGEWSAARALP